MRVPLAPRSRLFFRSPRPATRRARTLLPAGAVALALGCGGGDGPAGSPAVASVRLAQRAQTLTSINDSLRLAAAAYDGSGRAIAGVPLTWSLVDQGAAVALLDTNGLVRAQANGAARIVVAASNGKSDTATVTVQQAVATVVPSASTVTLDVGDTLRLSAVARDARGTPVAGAAYAWSSTDTSVVRVDAGGLLSARGTGAANVNVAAGGRTAAVPATVQPGSNPIVSAIAPDTLVPGATVTITGQNLMTAGAPSVTVLGIAATVTTASATQIVAQLPSVLPCEPTGSKPVVVSTGARAASRAHPVRTAERRALTVGESMTLLDPASARCNEIVGAGRYMMSVFNTGTAPSSALGFQVRGAVNTTLAAVHAPSMRLSETVVDQPATPASRIDPALLRAEREHLAHLERNRGVARSLGPAREHLRADRAARARSGGTGAMRSMSATATPQVGDVLTLKYHYGSCQQFTPVAARVKYVGTRAIVLEDTLAPRAGQMDSTFRLIGTEFDGVHYPILEQYYGNPLAMDGSLNADGRIYMLFTRIINDSLPGIAGFVSSCDFYPTSVAAASNVAEIFFARVAGANDDAEAWRRGMRSTVIHEVKHITSFAERFARGGGRFEDSWLEESTARLAEEHYSRTFAGGGSWKGNTGFATSVECELRRNCGDNRPLMMYKHYSAIYTYFTHSDSLTPIGRVGSSDFTFYGSGWSLVRWAADHHATDEAAFTRALVAGPETGIANLAAKAGRPFAELVADWTMASMLDDYPNLTTARAQLRLPSWNTRSIMAGLNAYNSNTWPSAFPLTARPVPHGAFTSLVPRLRSGTAAFFDLTVGTGGLPQLLELQSASGGTAPAGLGVSVVRIQ